MNAKYGALAMLSLAALMSIQAIRSFAGFESLQTVVRVVGWALAVVGPAWAIRRISMVGRMGRFARHAPHTLDQPVLIHEAGHALVARRTGSRVTKITANPDGSGYTRVVYRRGCTPQERIAIAIAGEIAEGSSVGAAQDRRSIRRTLRHVPRADRARVEREGYALGRREVSAARGAIRSEAERLRRNGGRL